jgi:CNT family concentrative nucleoside transporter
MQPPQSLETPVDRHDAPPPAEVYKPTPLSWRVGIAVVITAIGLAAYWWQEAIGYRGQAVAGLIFFFGIVAVFSANLRAVNWHTIFWGIALQLVLALLVLGKDRTYQITAIASFAAIVAALGFINVSPLMRGEKVRWPGLVGALIAIGIAYWIFFVEGVHKAFEDMGGIVGAFIDFSDKGAEFVFGNLAKPGDMAKVFGNDFIFCFAFKALPPILFVSAFFTVLYHLGVLQWCVRVFSLVMVHLMRTSGAETLSVAANVFMGQTEAPLIVKPYVPRMTNSELFVLMASGMAHISGSMMVVYISYGANPVAVLTTCVMACPCSLYLSKLFLPEVSKPETSGTVHTKDEKSPYVNAVDAAATGTTDGLSLALNVGAMLIVFIAFVALFDAVLGHIKPVLLDLGVSSAYIPNWLTDLSLGKVFGWIFSPVAFLMGVAKEDMAKVGSLLGSKLSINEHYAYLEMRKLLPSTNPVTGVFTPGAMSERSFRLTAFALTGFANFSSVGIQLGGIGGIAPNRRHDLARLGMRALFVGFTATLLNASVAGILLPNVVKPAQPTAASTTETGSDQNAATPTGTATPGTSEKSSPTSPVNASPEKAAPDKTPSEKTSLSTPEKGSTKQGSTGAIQKASPAATQAASPTASISPLAEIEKSHVPRSIGSARER